MAYLSLYRRYRPRRFGELRGQEHVVNALRNATRDGRLGHAYLFSGPRGTGKTTTARILAKVLNCTNLIDGEACLACESCLSIEAGTSFDLHELDAASNNKVEHVRELIERVAYSTPGRTKVYVLDEVHMLSAAASNALLKTLEEPPTGVVFVLATTEPQKVLPTIRSRTQHLEFHLLPADELETHVRWVIGDAGLDVTDEGVAFALRAGGGSARDTLSALEQVAAVGSVADDTGHVDRLVTAIVDRDTALALTAIGEAMAAGRDPKVLGSAVVSRLRDVFLAAVGVDLEHLADADRQTAEELAERAERPLVTRAIETLGDALVAMRDAPDQRVTLEVAVVRLTDPGLDISLAALLDRVERLERALAGAAATTPDAGLAAPPASASTPEPTRQTPPAGAREGTPAGARAALGALRPQPSGRTKQSTTPPPPPAAAPVPATVAPPTEVRAAAPTAASPAGDVPSRDELTLAWGDSVLHGLPNLVRALFAAGRFIEASGASAAFALPTAIHRGKCEPYRSDVEQALARHFGRPVPLQLVVDDGRVAAPPEAPEDEHRDDIGDVRQLEDAVVSTKSGLDLFTESFPGAQVVEGES